MLNTRSEEENRVNPLFMFGLFCECIYLEYVQVPVIYRVNQAEYFVHIHVAASQEYVNTYSTRRLCTPLQWLG